MNENIDIKSIYSILKNNIKLIAIITTLSLMLGFIFRFLLIEPEYETNTTILVKNNHNDASKISTDDINVSQRLAVTYGEIIKSRMIINKVIRDLDLNLSYNQLISHINVNIINGTEIMNIIVSYDNGQKTYEIANKLNEVFFSQARLLGYEENIQILDSPIEPQNINQPNIIINILLFTLIGLLLSILLIFIKEYFNDKIITEEDVEKYIGFPMIGKIESIINMSTNKDKNIESSHIPPESLKIIRANIEFLNVDNKVKLISVTSTKEKEGKTTVASQLSLSFAALENRRILLVDCNLSNPSIHTQFNINNNRGLTDILMNKNTIEECVKFIKIPNLKSQKLSVITIGKTYLNSSELLFSRTMNNLVNDLKSEYDYIFIDAPSIGLVSDASIISNISDGTIIVVGSGEIKIEETKILKEKLLNSRSNTIGVILNKSKDLSYGRYTIESSKKVCIDEYTNNKKEKIKYLLKILKKLSELKVKK